MISLDSELITQIGSQLLTIVDFKESCLFNRDHGLELGKLSFLHEKRKYQHMGEDLGEGETTSVGEEEMKGGWLLKECI